MVWAPSNTTTTQEPHTTHSSEAHSHHPSLTQAHKAHRLSTHHKAPDSTIRSNRHRLSITHRAGLQWGICTGQGIQVASSKGLRLGLRLLGLERRLLLVCQGHGHRP